jgi:hypothetical protein
MAVFDQHPWWPWGSDGTPSLSQHTRKTYNHGVRRKGPAWREGVPVWLGDGVRQRQMPQGRQEKYGLEP